MSRRGDDPKAGAPICGQSGTDQFQGQLSSFRATTDRSIMIVQATDKFKIFATRIGLEAGASRPHASCPLGLPVPLHKAVEGPFTLVGWPSWGSEILVRFGGRALGSLSGAADANCNRAVTANGNRMALARFGLAVSLQSGVMGWTICKPASCTDDYNSGPNRHAWAPGSVHQEFGPCRNSPSIHIRVSDTPAPPTYQRSFVCQHSSVPRSLRGQDWLLARFAGTGSEAS